MEKALQKQTMGDDFWAELRRGLVMFGIYAGITGILLLVSFWLGIYIAGLN